MKVRKAVIPAAGLGTRMLPATKTVPKEMLPLVDKPVIQYIIEEAVAAGIEDILVVTNRAKSAMDDYFDYYPELEERLARAGKARELSEVRRAAGDRAVRRAIHVFDENRRVLGQVQALENGDTEGFLALVNDSGRSSWEYLQNIAPEGAAGHQELAVTLALCRRLLRGRGAVRVHGGGFAGTALCMVPEADYPAFRAELEPLLAPDCCHRLQIV